MIFIKNKIIKNFIYFLLVKITISSLLSMHDNSIYYLNDKYQKQISYLINSDKIDIPFHLNQPFTVNQLREAINDNYEDIDYHFLDHLKFDLDKLRSNQNSFVINVGSNLDLSHSTQLFNKKFKYDVDIYGSATWNNFTVHSVYNYNSNALEDSLYFGNLNKFQSKLVSRISNSYIRYSHKGISLFFGKLDRNYGKYNSYSLIRSDNPYSYDHFSFDLENRYLKFTFSTSRLNDTFSYDSADSIYVNSWNKRYFSFHRLEFSPRNNLLIALTETVIYGGEEQNFVYSYLNPINIYFLTKMSDRKTLEENQANILMALDVYYKPIKNFILYAQVLVDDMDFTKELREKYPDRLGLDAQIHLIDLYPGSDLIISYTNLSKWTYNTFYTFGNYTFQGKSLGYPFNAYKEYSMQFNFFKLDKFDFSIGINSKIYRPQDLTIHFDYNSETGIKKYIKTSSLDVEYFGDGNLQFSASVAHQIINNFNHIHGLNKDYMNYEISVIYNYNFNKNLKLK